MAGVGGEDRVAELIETPFSRLPSKEKLETLRKGRPSPVLPGLVQATKRCERHFHTSSYRRYPWLTGSPRTNMLYCWNCLLFSPSKGPWSSAGFANLSCLTKAALKHQATPGHLRATVSLKTFGDTQPQSEQQRRETTAHNRKVRQNREILKRLIHTVVFLGKQELPFRGHDESRKSANKGNYLELLDYLAEYDSELRSHLATSKVFAGTSSKIQNDLISATAEVLWDAMKDEVKNTPFVAVMVDETTDVSNSTQMSLVLRYVTDSGIKERFFKFSDVTADKRAEAVAAHILAFLNEVGCTSKVVAQCYGGAAVMTSGLSGVQARVKEAIPQALFVHCYAHTLNLVMSQGAAKIKECKIFFTHLSGLAAFFSKLLDDTRQHRQPRVAPTWWTYTSRLVNTVYERREELREEFEHILHLHEDFDADTVCCADGYVNLMSSFEFRFLLATFNSIFALSDVLFDILQTKVLDMQFCLKRISDFCDTIERERVSFHAIYEETVGETGVPRRGQAGAQYDVRTHYQQLHSGIMDNLHTQVKDRFKDHKRLLFLALLDPQHFTAYRQSFPNMALCSLEETYGGHFNISRLKTELCVMYAMSDFEGRGPSDLLHFLQRKELTESMHQLHLLTCLVLTIPVSTASVEGPLSALERIKTYTRNSTGQDHLSALALISVEKELLMELKSKDKLYDPAIAHFVKKDCRVDFVFK